MGETASTTCHCGRPFEYTSRVFSNGMRHFQALCSNCVTNRSIKASSVPDDAILIDFDEWKAEHEFKRREAWKLERERGLAEWREQHSAYMQSKQWREIRAKVLARDSYICQGCLSATATEVHHKRYQPDWHDMAWDLVSICRDCHSTTHGRGD